MSSTITRSSVTGCSALRRLLRRRARPASRGGAGSPIRAPRVMAEHRVTRGRAAGRTNCVLFVGSTRSGSSPATSKIARGEPEPSSSRPRRSRGRSRPARSHPAARRCEWPGRRSRSAARADRRRPTRSPDSRPRPAWCGRSWLRARRTTKRCAQCAPADARPARDLPGRFAAPIRAERMPGGRPPHTASSPSRRRRSRSRPARTGRPSPRPRPRASRRRNR